MATRDELASSFGSAAEAYEAGRPSYPAEAVRWMLEPAGPRPRVADVGAGTGKLTREVLRTGADVIAVEPDAAMLDALRGAVPGVETLVGRAERMNLPDESLDAVVLGQAWHWVDVPAASAEVGRVLKPGGVLGLVWNIRDGSTPWVRRLGEIIGGSHAEELFVGEGPRVAAPFGALERESWRWSRRMDRDEILAMVRSRSSVITASEWERARIDREVGALLDEVGAVAGTTVELPYATHAFRCVRD